MNSAAQPALHSEQATYVWTFPGAPVRIRIPFDLVRQIREYVTTGLKGAAERGGLLIGSAQGHEVEITDFKPWERFSNSRTQFILTGGETIELKKHIEELNARQRGSEVLGYFRSDFREGVRLYDQDLALIQDAFWDPRSVFLIVQPSDNPPAAGFFFWDGDRVFPYMSFLEFPFDEAALIPDVGASVPLNEPTPREPEIVVDTPPRVDYETPPAARRSSRPVILLAFLFVLLFGAYALWQRATFQRIAEQPPLERPAPVPIGLSVFRSGTDIRIRWDAASTVVAGARNGRMTIIDGDARRDVPLSAQELRMSSLVYAPHNDRVRVALEVFARDGSSSREEVILVSAIAAKPVSGAWDPHPIEVRIPVTVVHTGRVTSSAPQRSFVPPAPVQQNAAPHIAAPQIGPPVDAPALNARVDLPRVDTSSVDHPSAPITPVVAAPSPTVAREEQPAFRPPVPIRQVAPTLPVNVKQMLSRRTDVSVRVKVDESGRVISAEPIGVTGSLTRLLGAAAANAARMWKFQPATDGNSKLAGELTLEFSFVPGRQ